MVLTKTPSLWMLRTTARNRVGNQLARTPVANPRRGRSPRLQTRSEVPATPLSLRLGAPVSQRYRDGEDALDRQDPPHFSGAVRGVPFSESITARSFAGFVSLAFRETA